MHCKVIFSFHRKWVLHTSSADFQNFPNGIGKGHFKCFYFLFFFFRKPVYKVIWFIIFFKHLQRKLHQILIHFEQLEVKYWYLYRMICDEKMWTWPFLSSQQLLDKTDLKTMIFFNLKISSIHYPASWLNASNIQVKCTGFHGKIGKSL